jgi:predicted peptidase
MLGVVEGPLMVRNLRYFHFLIAFSIMAFPGASRATDLSNTITGTVSDGTASIPYRLFQPTVTDPSEKLPLILFLHGMGDRGTDNVGQTYWMNNLAAKTSGGQYAAYVLAPQINTNMWFASGSSTPSEAMSLTLQALHQAMSNPNVDTSRIYVTGVSMGGMGTWDILRRDPSVFAAAVPMSGGGDPSTADTIKNIPIWAFHGSADDVVSVDSTRAMIQALQDAGGSPNYTEVDGGGHYIWPEIYQDANDTLYPWLFSQHLPGAADPSLVPMTSMETASITSAQVVAAVTPVPEPGALGLLAMGGLTLLARRR